MLSGKNILLGITGSIAAYKAAYLVRYFIKAGAQVRVVMTPAAKDFVTPLTLSTLSKNPVLSQFTDEDEDGKEWNNHVELGLWADVMVIAPASANTMAKMASGTVDNLLLATYLSAKCPVYFAPAMDLDMYKHPATTANMQQLQEMGNIYIPAGTGELASGLVGEGRMAEPEEILEFITNHIQQGLPLYGKKLLVSAGPTFEQIDPVRFIGNNSSGKMGYALAATAAELGAEVTLVSGPTALPTPDGVTRIDVTDAASMYEACTAQFPAMDVAIMAAAVADFTPKAYSDKKIKKGETLDAIPLTPTRDILKALGQLKTHQLLAGFALETNNEVENAQKKLATKNLDFIVLNSLQDEGAGFQHETNKVTIIEKDNKMTSFELKSKTAVANDIMHKVIELLK